MPATIDLRRGQVVGDASRRWAGLNTMTHAVANATYAPIASPTFTGDPQAPTPAPSDNDTSVATTAFVHTAVAAAGGITQLTGDATAGPGSGAQALALAAVNSNVGTFQGLTVNAKGLVTAATNQSYAPLASPALTGTPTVNGAAFAAGHLPGTATNDSAAAGQVGEVISALVTTGVAMATGVATAIATISLTPGDWDVSGEVWLNGTGMTQLSVAINTAAAIPGGVSLGTGYTGWQGTANYAVLPVAPVRQSLAATTGIYLVGIQYGAAGVTGTGKIWARRAR